MISFLLLLIYFLFIHLLFYFKDISTDIVMGTIYQTDNLKYWQLQVPRVDC